MNMQKINETLLEMIQRWDPLGCGHDAYEMEAIDVLQAVHECDEIKLLARKIQSIYEFSFEEVIPFEKCVNMAKLLLDVKNDARCSIQ